MERRGDGQAVGVGLAAADLSGRTASSGLLVPPNTHRTVLGGTLCVVLLSDSPSLNEMMRRCACGEQGVLFFDAHPSVNTCMYRFSVIRCSLFASSTCRHTRSSLHLIEGATGSVNAGVVPMCICHPELIKGRAARGGGQLKTHLTLHLSQLVEKVDQQPITLRQGRAQPQNDID